MYHSSYAQWSATANQWRQGYRENAGDEEEQGSPLRAKSPERERDKEQDATYAAKLRAVQQLSLIGNPSSSYTDNLCGPLRPGFEFYKLLSYSPTLYLRIPATVYVKKSKIYLLSTNDKGVVTRTFPDYNSEDFRSRFIQSFIASCVQTSRSPVPKRRRTSNETLGRGSQILADVNSSVSNIDAGDSMISRIVAVQKKKQWGSHIRNTTQVHTTLSLKAALQVIFDGEDDEMFMQQYIKPKGRTANVFRVFWRREPGLLSNSVAYNIANKDNFFIPVSRDMTRTTAVIVGNRYHAAHGTTPHAAVVATPVEQEREEDSVESSTESVSVEIAPVRPRRAFIATVVSSVNVAPEAMAVPAETGGDETSSDNEENPLLSLHTSLYEVDRKLRYLVENDSLNLEPGERVSAIKIGADVDRSVNDSMLCSLSRPLDLLPGKVSITRLSSRAMPGVVETMDDLVIWIQHAVQRKYDLNLTLSELVCDFIRGEDGEFTFLQVKAFKLSDASLITTALWSKIFFSAHSNKDDDCDRGLVINNEIDPRETWRARSGRKKVSISDMTNKLREEVGDKCRLCGCCYVMGQVVQIRAEDGVLNVKAMVRDSQTLTQPSSSNEKIFNVPVFGYDISVKLACLLLESYRDSNYPLGKYARNVLLGYTRTLDATSAQATFIPEKIDDAREETMFVAEDTRNRPMGFITACYICDEILRQKQLFVSKTKELNTFLGVPVPSQDEDEDEMNDTMVASLRAADINKFIYSVSHFKKHAVQWRMLIMAHYISDVILPSSSPYLNAAASLNYTLGPYNMQMSFTVRTEVRDGIDMMLVLIKQCRLHYIFATEEDMKMYFASNEIKLSLAIQPVKKSTSMNKAKDGIELSKMQPSPSEGKSIGRQKGSVDQGKTQNFVEIPMPVKFNQLVFRDETAPVHRKFHMTHSEKGCWGAEKIDIMVPIDPSVMGQFAKLRLSVAVVSDSEYHERLVDCRLMVEGTGIFWPEGSYFDDRPLPDSWLEMLTPIGDSAQAHKQPVFSDDVEKLRSSVSELTTKIAFAKQKAMKLNSGRPSSAPVGRKSRSTSIDEPYHKKERDERFNIPTALRVVENIDDALKQYKKSPKKIPPKMSPSLKSLTQLREEQNSKVSTQLADKASVRSLKMSTESLDTSAELKQRRRATAVLSLSKKFTGTILDLTNKSSSTNDDSSSTLLPTAMLASRFISNLGGISSSDDGDEKDDDKSDEGVGKDGLEEKSTKGKDEENISVKNKEPSGEVMDAEFIALSNTLTTSIQRSVVSSTKRRSSVKLSHAADEKLFPEVSSTYRKTRRFMMFMRIFEHLSGNEDHVDVYDLKVFLEMQRSRLAELVNNYRDHKMELPLVHRNYETDVEHVDSHIKYIIICLHLLLSSPKLTRLMSLYESKGVAVLNQVGFFTAAEECFQIIDRAVKSEDMFKLASKMSSEVFELLEVLRKRARKTTFVKQITLGTSRGSKVRCPLLFMCCDFHGETPFYASDGFCMQCDKDYSKLDH